MSTKHRSMKRNLVTVVAATVATLGGAATYHAANPELAEARVARGHFYTQSGGYVFWAKASAAGDGTLYGIDCGYYQGDAKWATDKGYTRHDSNWQALWNWNDNMGYNCGGNNKKAT